VLHDVEIHITPRHGAHAGFIYLSHNQLLSCARHRRNQLLLRRWPGYSLFDAAACCCPHCLMLAAHAACCRLNLSRLHLSAQLCAQPTCPHDLLLVLLFAAVSFAHSKVPNQLHLLLLLFGAACCSRRLHLPAKLCAAFQSTCCFSKHLLLICARRLLLMMLPVSSWCCLTLHHPQVSST
jgi:hypothetical protein